MSRIQGKAITDGPAVYAGVDVSKASLDLHVVESGSRGLARRFTNDEAGIAALVAALSGRSGGRTCKVVFEPTGRLHHALWRALHAAGHATAPYNPHWARQFAGANGQLAKTDAIDARMLAFAAASIRLPVVAPPAEDQLRIKELHGLRLGVVAALTAAKTRRHATTDDLGLRLLDAQIGLLDAQRGELDAELHRLIAEDPARTRRRDILISIPGVGPASTVALCADMPELGQLTDKAAAALLGTAPMDRESGNTRGRATPRGGRRRLRAALHMAAIAAARANPDLKAFAQRLKARGKPGKVIITAVLRKLIILANALIRDDRLWTPRNA